MKASWIAFGMLLMTAGAANAGGLVTRHQSSLQHIVDPVRTTTSRTANSYAISGTGVSLDVDADTTGNDLSAGGFATITNGAAAPITFQLLPLLMEKHFSSTTHLQLVMQPTQLEQ